MPEEDNYEESRIPVNIITGFLGSGKTTLLNHWVNTPEFKDTLVLINEFGDVGLDHELVESFDDSVVLLSNGCICCTLQGELINALANNLAKARNHEIPTFRRVLIETTGLADPSGVVSTINRDEFCYSEFYYDGTITILDGQFLREQIKKQYEVVKQIALADVILVSKVDLIDQAELDEITAVARKINPTVAIHPVRNGEIDPQVLLNVGPYRETMHQDYAQLKNWMQIKDGSVASPFRPAQVNSDLGVARPQIIAHSDIDSFSFIEKEPIDGNIFLAAINEVQGVYGDSVLRLKGLLNLKGQPYPVIVHGIQGNLYPLAEMDHWPEDPVTKIVFIVRASVMDQVQHTFEEAIRHPRPEVIDSIKEMMMQVYSDADSNGYGDPGRPEND
ncbi:MAG: GTP-binding protein [Succinivibrionaceae bacterium]|nr:GTP-binding protein [Succinivibrionaceae bacterium]